MEEQAEPAKTPDELFAEFMQKHNFIPVVLVTSPIGGQMPAAAFIDKRLRDDGWQLIVTVREAKQQ